MKCVYCDEETKVINSRLQKKANQVWRRRNCTACGAIFTSIERVDTEQALSVVKNDAHQPFSRDKLLFSIYDSLKHRKTAESDATALTATILGKLMKATDEATITRQKIVDLTYEVLNNFDNAAATHYQAFHQT